MENKKLQHSKRKATTDESSLDYLSIVKMLPSIDWNIKFYGGHIGQVGKGWTAPLEAHIGFEVLTIIEGRQTTTIYEEQLILEKGDIIIIPSGIPHVNCCQHEQGLTYFCAHFHIDDPLFRIQMLRQQELIYRSGTEQNEQLQAIISKWMTMFKGDHAYTSTDHFSMQMVLFELCVALTSSWDEAWMSNNEGYGKGVNAGSTFTKNSSNHDADGSRRIDNSHALSPSAIHYAKMIAERLKLYFSQHVTNKQDYNLAELKIEVLIESLGISSGYGLEVFRNVYGISPRKYLSELKLHEAKVLIQQANLSLSNIAEQLGYSHLSHFSRQFKRWTGVSPLEYRKQLAVRD